MLLRHSIKSLEKYTNTIDTCSACAIECSRCVSTCLEEQNVKMFAHCIKLNHDCASICILAMQAMASGSAFVNQICELCAEICKVCAGECERHAHEHCKRCAEACRSCAVECSKISKS